jgi:hypothetical protein
LSYTKTAQVSKTTKLLLKSRLQLLNEPIFDFRRRALRNTVGLRHLDKKPSIGSQQLPLNPIQNGQLILAQERALRRHGVSDQPVLLFRI